MKSADAAKTIEIKLQIANSIINRAPAAEAQHSTVVGARKYSKCC